MASSRTSAASRQGVFQLEPSALRCVVLLVVPPFLGRCSNWSRSGIKAWQLLLEGICPAFCESSGLDTPTGPKNKERFSEAGCLQGRPLTNPDSPKQGLPTGASWIDAANNLARASARAPAACDAEGRSPKKVSKAVITRTPQSSGLIQLLHALSHLAPSCYSAMGASSQHCFLGCIYQFRV